MLLTVSSGGLTRRHRHLAAGMYLVGMEELVTDVQLLRRLADAQRPPEVVDMRLPGVVDVRQRPKVVFKRRRSSQCSENMSVVDVLSVLVI
jgi:hypothetical protein